MAVCSALTGSIIAVSSRRLKVLHYAVIQFSYGLLATIVMAIFLIVHCVANGKLPYVYPSGWVYA